MRRYDYLSDIYNSDIVQIYYITKPNNIGCFSVIKFWLNITIE